MKTYKKLHESKEVANIHIAKIKERGGNVKQSIKEGKILLEYSFPNKFIVYRTEKAHSSYKGKSVWGDGLYFGLNKDTVADMTTNPHSEYFEEPDYNSVKEYIIPKDIRIKTIDIANMPNTEFNKFPKGNDLKKMILSKGYDGVLLLTDDDLNYGGDQLILYNKESIKKVMYVR